MTKYRRLDNDIINHDMIRISPVGTASNTVDSEMLFVSHSISLSTELMTLYLVLDKITGLLLLS